MSKQNNPAWVLVSSSAIQALAYSPETAELFVRFAPSGAEYAYSNVTASEHSALITAGSLGHYFNQHIKATHEFRRLTAEGGVS